MRRYAAIIAVGAAFILDTMVFGAFNRVGFRPEAMMAVVVSLAAFIGALPAAATGVVMGLLIDSLLNAGLGLNSIFMLIAALGGGALHNSQYGNNPMVAALIAALAMLVKEHIMLLVSVFTGRNIGHYVALLLRHILPSMLLTGGICALVHRILRATLFKVTWHSDVEN